MDDHLYILCCIILIHNLCRDIASTLLYIVNLDYATIETKSVVAQWAIFAC